MKRISERHFFYSLLFLHLIYLWIIPVFLTQDGPSHLYNSRLLLDFFSGSPGFYSDYFVLNLRLFPNWFSNILLSCLLVFFKPLIAEKIFLTFLFVALPLSFRYCIKSINPGSVFLSSFAFLFTNSFFLVYGFYNFQWSIVFFLLFIGVYFRHDHSPKFYLQVLLYLIPVILFFTHPVALIVALFFTGYDSLITFRNRIPSSSKALLKFILKQLLIAGPSIALFFIYIRQQPSAEGSAFENKFSLHNLKMLVSLGHLSVFSCREQIVFGGFTLLFILIVFLCILKGEKNDLKGKNGSLLMSVGFCMLVYFFVSDRMAGGAYLTIRMLVFIYLLILLFAAALLDDFRYKNLFVLAPFAGSVLLLAIRFPVQHEIGKKMQEYISFEKEIPEHSTLLPLSFSNYGELGDRILSPRLAIFRHIGGYVASGKEILCFDNYEANTDYFPLRWKKEMNPYLLISKGQEDGLETNPPSVDLVSHPPGGRIDYVLLWGDPGRFRDSAVFKDLCCQLQRYFVFVSSSPDGFARLYKNKTAVSAKPL